MKARIEARDLRDTAKAFADGLDRRQIVWLVQRSQRHEPTQVD
jgi:hypothetical protein